MTISQLTSKDFQFNNNSVKMAPHIKGPGVLFLYANWCGACTKTKPVFSQIEKLIGNRFNLTAIEESQIGNPVLANSLKIEYFPTIRFFDSNGTLSKNYTGPRDIDSLLNYICNYYHTCQ